MHFLYLRWAPIYVSELRPYPARRRELAVNAAPTRTAPPAPHAYRTPRSQEGLAAAWHGASTLRLASCDISPELAGAHAQGESCRPGLRTTHPLTSVERVCPTPTTSRPRKPAIHSST